MAMIKTYADNADEEDDDDDNENCDNIITYTWSWSWSWQSPVYTGALVHQPKRNQGHKPLGPLTQHSAPLE